MQSGQMQRREFITLIGGTAAAWPLAARAQQSSMPVVGFLRSSGLEGTALLVLAFRQGLSEVGFVEGRNVTIEYRWADNQLDRLPQLAAELVQRRVSVIATPASTPATLAAKAATAAIPIVFGIGGDPVALGLVASLNRPGGNVTGIVSMNLELAAKQLGLLHELLPAAARFAVLVNPDNSTIAEATITDVRAAARSIGRQIEVLTASTNHEIDSAFASPGHKRADALLVNSDPLFYSRRVHLTTLATYHRVPTITVWRDSVEAGGLMSYGSDLANLVRQVGVYSGRILKGEKPAELPVLRATKFELVVNLQTAKIFGLEVPATLLARADEVIE
jgi:putative tryptophan/tyrosine transport system substrate-binding protein